MPSKDEIKNIFEVLKNEFGVQGVTLEFLPFNRETYKGGESEVYINEYERVCACAYVKEKTIWINSLRIDNGNTGLYANWHSVIAHELGHIKLGFQKPAKYSIDTSSNQIVDFGVTRYIDVGLHAAIDISSDQSLPPKFIQYNYVDVSPLKQCDPIALKKPTTKGIVEISTEIPFWCAYKQIFPNQESDRISSELEIIFNSLNHKLNSLAHNTETILQPFALGTSIVCSEDSFLALMKNLNETYLNWIASM